MLHEPDVRIQDASHVYFFSMRQMALLPRYICLETNKDSHGEIIHPLHHQNKS